MTEKLLDLILKPISNKSYNQIDKILVYLLSLWSQPWVTIEYIINYIFFFVIRSRSSTIFQIQYNSEDDDNAQCPLRPLSSVAIYCHEYKSFYNFFSRKVISRDKKIEWRLPNVKLETLPSRTTNNSWVCDYLYSFSANHNSQCNYPVELDNDRKLWSDDCDEKRGTNRANREITKIVYLEPTVERWQWWWWWQWFRILRNIYIGNRPRRGCT